MAEQEERSWDVVVVGATLAGLAAAARLARQRHRVVVLEASPVVGGRLAPYPREPGRTDDPADDRDDGEDRLVDDWPMMLTFPAPWRDLFRKSGRPFDDELARAGQALVPAPAARHRFADGTELVLPTDRAVQLSVLSRAYGGAAAARWRDLLDRLDEVWQALRPLGMEAPWYDEQQLRLRRHVLQPGRTVADLARDLGEPHLAALILDTAHRLGSRPDRTPAWCAAQLSAERHFGRWMMTAGGRPVRASTLLDRLVDRLGTRRVTVLTGTEVVGLLHERGAITGVLADGMTHRAPEVILTQQPWQAYDLVDRPRSLPRDVRRRLADEHRAVRRTRPSLAPEVTHRIVEPAGVERAGDEPTETVRHTDRGPVVEWTRPTADGRTLVSVHDWTAARPDPGAGIAWRGWRTALRRPPISSALPGLHLAGPHSRGGALLPAVVLSGALASYAGHDRLVAGRSSGDDRAPNPSSAD